MRLKSLRNAYLLGCLLLQIAIAGAQEEVRIYLGEIKPILVSVKNQIDEFSSAIEPLREQKDVSGLNEAATRDVDAWVALEEQLQDVEPPEVAVDHYQALIHLVRLQRQRSQLLADAFASQLSVAREANKMKESGATKEEIEAHVRSTRLDPKETRQKIIFLQDQAAEADETLHQETSRLVEMIKKS
jgi:hypothetical protein